MLLRSSSTPILGSLLSDSSSHHLTEVVITPNHHFKKVLYPPSHVGSHNFKQFSSTSSPSSPSVYEFSCGKQLSRNGFRKVMSDGNLEGLIAVHDPCNGEEDEFTLAIPLKTLPRVNGLETIPSFSFHGSRSYEEGEEEEMEAAIDGVNQGSKAEMSMKAANGREQMSLKVAERRNMCLVNSGSNGGGGGGDDPSGGNGGGGGGCGPVSYGRGGGDSHGFSMEEHYKKMLVENPSNPLFLRNYANFLYQTKGDSKGAEEYYSRAILADPGDGEVLSQYANLVWELHLDADRAMSYFEQAVQAAAEDSHVHAAYARFLWEIEDNEDEEEDDVPSIAHMATVTPPGAMASASA